MRPPCQPVARLFMFAVPRDLDANSIAFETIVNAALDEHDVRAIYHTFLHDPCPGSPPDSPLFLFVFGRSYVPCDDAPPPA